MCGVSDSKQRDVFIEIQANLLGVIFSQTDGNGSRVSFHDSFWNFLVQGLFYAQNEKQIARYVVSRRNARGYRMVDGQKRT